MKKAILILVGLAVLCGGGFMLLSIGGILSMGEAIQEAESQPGGSRETAVALGETLQVEDLAYTIEGAEVLPVLTADNDFLGDMEPDGGGVWVRVMATIENPSSSRASVWGMSLQDANETTYSGTIVMDDYLGGLDSCTLDSLNPGLSTECAAVFQVPESAIGPDLMLRISGIGLTSGGYVELGLSTP